MTKNPAQEAIGFFTANPQVPYVVVGYKVYERNDRHKGSPLIRASCRLRAYRGGSGQYVVLPPTFKKSEWSKTTACGLLWRSAISKPSKPEGEWVFTTGWTRAGEHLGAPVPFEDLPFPVQDFSSRVFGGVKHG